MLTFKDKLWCFFPGCDVTPWSTPGLCGQLHSSLDWCWCHRVPTSAGNEGTVIVLTLILQHWVHSPHFFCLSFPLFCSVIHIVAVEIFLFQACNLSEYSLACFAYGQEFCLSDPVLFRCMSSGRFVCLCVQACLDYNFWTAGPSSVWLSTFVVSTLFCVNKPCAKEPFFSIINKQRS